MLNLENFDADTKENGNPFKSSGKRLAVEGVACCACHKSLGKICRKRKSTRLDRGGART